MFSSLAWHRLNTYVTKVSGSAYGTTAPQIKAARSYLCHLHEEFPDAVHVARIGTGADGEIVGVTLEIGDQYLAVEFFHQGNGEVFYQKGKELVDLELPNSKTVNMATTGFLEAMYKRKQCSQQTNS